MLLDDYLLFATIVESGSLSAAARALKLSPAMVSKRLAAMERRLGAQLLKRTTRRLALTDVGEAFYERVARILAASREAEAMVAGRAGAPSGRLRVSAPTSFGRLHIAPRLTRFLDDCPDVRLEFNLSDAFIDLIDGEADVAVRIGPPPPATLAAHRLAANHRILCAAPRYLAAYGAPERIAALSHHRLLAASGQLPWRLTGPEGPQLLEGRSHVQTNSSELVRELAIGGAGIALRSTWDIAPELAAGRLVRVLPVHEGARDVAIYAVHPRGDPVPPNVRAFVAFLKSLFAPAPPWEAPPAVSAADTRGHR